ncbi:MAG: division/cell wall cluster transcriptional repressor MraZ [Bacteroidia bacterium]|jgi:MraZ protein|uniref:Transcriptional regulator MraZ n=1 Tax=bioreactor metagenome TaxID=1076179 RepID=A0A644YVQ6_9ZZZZ|nr:protein mraZ [Rikenellaceae bacterium]NCB18260.1 division/cell wall cluster transcriptional repressor MraZ [Bacteroidia bacterium]
MVKFIGEYTTKIDDKGRVVFPSSLKSMLGSDEDQRFVIKKDLFFNCLEMYTYQEWIRQSEEVKSRLNFFKKEHALFWREYMRDRALVEPDGKLGRISIPKRLLDEIGVRKELLFAGNDHKIEIWAKESYDQERLPGGDYSELAEKILG